jgi:Flp pilus assembly protein TadB
VIAPALAGAAVAGAGTSVAVGWSRWRARLGERAVQRVEASEDLAADLAALGADAPSFVASSAARIVVSGAVGVIVAVAAWGLVGPAGLLVVPAGSALGALTARWSLTRQAAAARNALRVAGLEMAELISLAIGGGLGVPAALDRASTTVGGHGGDRLRTVVAAAHEPWAALEAFGERVRVAELTDLGRTLAVGVDQQARTREVLLGWAQAARAARLEEAEAAAAATTEAMTGPLALVAFGFLLMVGIPAVVQLLSGVSAVHL